MVACRNHGNFRTRLQQEWQQADGWQWWLLPLSWIYRLVMMLRKLAYRAGWLKSHRLAVPVIVIGNISVGGTGKTPLTIWLAHQLTKRGIKTGIILRGYGSRQAGPLAVLPDSDPALAGDEAVVLARSTDVPVWRGRDRVATGRAMLAQVPDLQLILCDDGLQHLALTRDCEIIVIDGERGFGNGRLLPAGPLREPLSRLTSADAIVINLPAEPIKPKPVSRPDIRHRLPAQLSELLSGLRPSIWQMNLIPGLLRNLKQPERQADSTHFRGQLLHAVAGIGNPERFFRQMETAGLLIERHAFPDHHAYQANELDFAGNIIMTEKDAVKCTYFATEHMWAWPVDVEADERLVDSLLTATGVRHG